MNNLSRFSRKIARSKNFLLTPIVILSSLRCTDFINRENEATGKNLAPLRVTKIGLEMRFLINQK